MSIYDLTNDSTKIIIILNVFRKEKFMKFLNKMERKFGKYAIKNLMYYIIGLYILGFLIQLFQPEIYNQYLSLDAEAILRGQVWRIVTFIISPPGGSAIFMIFVLYLYYWIGTSLERVWGAFRFNVYFFTGVLLHVLGAIFVYLIFRMPITMDTYFLNMSLFLAFAAIYPDMKLMLFFVIPIKIKWLGILNAVYFGVTIISGFVTYFYQLPELTATYGVVYYEQLRVAALARSIAALISLMNFLIFFFATRSFKKNSPVHIYRKAKFKKEASVKKSSTEPRHKCSVCGRTEKDGDDLVFRYCSKCDGNHEYCQDHLFTHEHVKKE